MKNVMIIGIAGGSGSGKKTLTNKICERFAGRVSVVYHDAYYRAHPELNYEQRSQLNYDHPDSFETELMIEHLKRLKDGEAIDCPVYDYSDHNRSDKTVRIEPAPVIVVEGILVFADRRLRELMDIKIFVDTDADERILRRILRDTRERGRSVESVVNQYRRTVKPMHEQFVEPSKRFADIIVLDGGYNLVALDMIMMKIRNHLS